MLREHHFHPADILLEAIGFAQRTLVIVGHGGKKSSDFDRVEAAHCLAEFGLSKIEGAYIHAPVFSHPVIGRERCRVYG